jgi:hypothetical protein
MPIAGPPVAASLDMTEIRRLGSVNSDRRHSARLQLNVPLALQI